MKNFNKAIALLLTLILSIWLFTGCGSAPQKSQETAEPSQSESFPAESSEAEPAPDEPSSEESSEISAHEGKWEFTDSLGRTVSFEGPLTRVAPSGKMAQQCIYAISPECIIGLSSELSKAEIKYLSPEFAELPIFGTFYGKKANFNRESVLAADSQVVIDVGQQKDNMADDLDDLQEQLGIPVIFIEATLSNMAPAFETLGELLDAPQQGQALAAYCSGTISDAEAKAASIPEDQRKTVYYGMMDSGLTTCAQGDFHAGVLDLVGAVNVVPSDAGHSFIDVDMERVLNWNPEVIIFAPTSVYDSAASDPVWKDLSAIDESRYYEVPIGPYNWIDQPPAANRIIGVKWLGNLLYPDVFDYDMAAETITFYDLFYHVQLNEDEAKGLMAKSTYKAG